MSDEIRIIQINIRSLNKNKNLLEYILHRDKIDIALISETWLNNDNTSISGYTIYNKNRVDGYGGVAILISNKIISSAVTHTLNFEPLEVITTKITLNKQEFNFTSIYVPPNTNTKAIKLKFQMFIDSIQQLNNSIFGGDVNALHPLWDETNKNNIRGNVIADIISQSNFCTLNNGNQTRVNFNANTMSAIDISGASSSIANSMDWKVLQDNLGSDHLPILMTIQLTNCDIPQPKKYIQNKKLDKFLDTVNFDDTNNIEDFENKLEDIIKMHTKIKTNTKNTDKPWWNPKIERLWLVKKQKQLVYNKNSNLYTAKELKNSIKSFREEIKLSKRRAWEEFTADINPSTSIRDIYKKINILNKKRQTHKNNYLDSIDKNQKLLHLNYDTIDYTLEEVEKQLNSDAFLVEEIAAIINKNKNSAGGVNGISNKILKMLKPAHLTVLTKHLNKMWNMQLFPESWKKAKAIAFPKINKDASVLTNYRIISLLNVTHKMFGKLIKQHICEHIIHHKLLPQDTYGFREGVGCNEYVVRLKQIIERNNINNLKSIVLTVDITKAFDKVNTNTLQHILVRMKFERKFIFWILETLRHRQITMGEGNCATKCVVSEGLPQGDILSPILFNLYTVDLHKLQNSSTEVLQYADDFTFIISDINESALNAKASQTMRQIKLMLDELNFEINPDKCKYITINCSPFSSFQVWMFDSLIEKANHLKILGIFFDDKINFKKHVKETKDNAAKYVNLLKIFNSKRGGAHPRSSLNVFNALVKSRTTYGSPCTFNLSKSQVQSLQVTHNAALRHCLGMVKSSPVTALLGEAGDWPIEYSIELQNIKFIAKHLYSNSIIGNDIRNGNSTSNLNAIYLQHPSLQHIPTFTPLTSSVLNLKICCNILGYSNKLLTTEKLTLATDMIAKYNDTYKIYTDGSKSDNGAGLGIYFDDTEECISRRINTDLSIKTIEIMAIFMAINLALLMGKKNIVVFTDSRSSCQSLLNTCKTKKYIKKYYESKIIHLAIKNKDCQISIQWLPAHIGLQGNETADRLAGDCTNTNTLDEIQIPPEEAINICKNTLHNKWTQEFIRRTQTKGKFHAQIIKNPSLKPWFCKSSLGSAELKQIIRLRSGHSFDKKFKALMRVTDSNACNTCNTLEDAVHIIEHCPLYTLTRQKYSNTIRKGLLPILQSNNENDLLEITKFLQEIKYDL